MAKIRILVTAVCEFDPMSISQEAYPSGANTVEARLEEEVQSAIANPKHYADMLAAAWNVTGEVVS